MPDAATDLPKFTAPRIIPRLATPWAFQLSKSNTNHELVYRIYLVYCFFALTTHCLAEESGERFLIGSANSPHNSTREKQENCKPIGKIGRNSLCPWHLRICNYPTSRTPRLTLHAFLVPPASAAFWPSGIKIQSCLCRHKGMGVMPRKRLLASWIGHNDMRAFALSLPAIAVF